MQTRWIFLTCVLALLAAACGESLGFGGSSRCDSFQLNDSASAHFERRGEILRLLVDLDGQPGGNEVSGSTVDSSMTFMISVSASGEAISSETPGVEAIVRGADSAYLGEEVVSVAPGVATTQCDLGDFRVDYVKVDARSGFTVGGQEFRVPDNVPAGGVFVQQLLS